MARLLNEISSMPQMENAFAGWFMPITLTRITQTVTDDGFVATDSENITFKGVIQPLTPKQLMLKPEGERAWKWLQIHCLAGSLNLDTSDRITYNGEKFKVMAQNDYTLNNFIEYHLCKDYQDANE